MTSQDKKRLKKYKQLRKLIKKKTKKVIIARHAPIGFPAFADGFMESYKLEDQILEFLYGTSDLVELGLEWGVLKPRTEKRRKSNKKKK